LRLAERVIGGDRSARRWAALSRLEALAVEGGRTKSVLTGAGSVTLRRCITERKEPSGVLVWSAVAQAVRHLQRSVSTGWTEDVLAAPEMLAGLLSGEEADGRDEARSSIGGVQT